jgi:hypothetical protein
VINVGQARRIAAEWQAPGNSCSLLQHKGVIDPGLIEELDANLATEQAKADRQIRIELIALREFARVHLDLGHTQVRRWGAWDETPVAA